MLELVHGTEYEILTSIPANTNVTRLKKGINDGETWDKVQLENGVIGYVFASYLKEVIKEDWNLEFDNNLNVEGNVISSIPWEDTTISNIQKLISTDLKTSFENVSNNRIGTGSKLILTDTNGNKLNEYEFILYGDLDGDGLINSKDILVLQKHILEIKILEGVYYKAANLSKNGNAPSALDMLKLQKHVLEISFIEQ